MAFAHMSARISLAVLSFCAVLLCAPWASATVFSQCESGPLMSVPSEVLISELPDMRADGCDGLVIERSGQVPICLLEGASAVAERPVEEHQGPVMEADDGTCVEAAPPDQATAPRDEPPTEGPQSTPGALDARVPGVPEMPPPLMAETRRPAAMVVPSGHAVRVFRPPRS
jgi:hypothetical protein